MSTTQAKPTTAPDPARVFGRAEMDRLMQGEASKIRRAIKYLRWQLRRGVSRERAYHDMVALEAALSAEMDRRAGE